MPPDSSESESLAPKPQYPPQAAEQNNTDQSEEAEQSDVEEATIEVSNVEAAIVEEENTEVDEAEPIAEGGGTQPEVEATEKIAEQSDSSGFESLDGEPLAETEQDDVAQNDIENDIELEATEPETAELEAAELEAAELEAVEIGETQEDFDEESAIASEEDVEVVDAPEQPEAETGDGMEEVFDDRDTYSDNNASEAETDLVEQDAAETWDGVEEIFDGD
ncbi:MAG: hypothetical protein AAGA67_06825, partial [Cyanobacteria bacterium P01_F01_bin.153]